MAGGTLYLIFIQITSRALTFVGNQVLLRYLSPSLLGIAVQLELVAVTVLYFARESLRVALQRRPSVLIANGDGTQTQSSQKRDAKGLIRRESQAVVNLSYLAITLGICIALLSSLSYLNAAGSEVLQCADFNTTFYLYGVATLVELLAEPAFVVIQQHALYRARARAETTAAIARCLLACLTAVLNGQYNRQASILPFAVGQLAYAVVLFIFYIQAARNVCHRLNFSLLPHALSTSTSSSVPVLVTFFDQSMLSLAATLYLQSIFKLLLTQGDALILSVLSTLADQGAFALASNYGGLLARLVFQPIEESSRNAFGRLLTSPPSSDHSSKRTSDHQLALSQLTSTLHFYMLLSFPLFTIAPYLLPLLVRHVIGAAWYNSSTASLLSTYCYYIPFMAVNGILDAFVTSVATPAQLRVQAVWMAVFTGIYGCVAWVMLQQLHLGAEGLVWANIVNMGIRIIWSYEFIRKWVNQQSHSGLQAAKVWTDSMPAWPSVMVTSGVLIALNIGLADKRLHPSLQTSGVNTIDIEGVALVVAAGAVLGATILITERKFLLSMLETFVPPGLVSKSSPSLSSSSSRTRASLTVDEDGYVVDQSKTKSI